MNVRCREAEGSREGSQRYVRPYTYPVRHHGLSSPVLPGSERPRHYADPPD